MFKVNDTVVYGAQGICRISGITTKIIKKQQKKYYVLSPLYKENSQIFVPLDNENLTQKMNKVMSENEIKELISSLPSEECKWIEDDNERKTIYRKALESGDRHSVVKVIKALYEEQQRRKAEKKKLSVSDEMILSQAENLLYDELAAVLNIKPEEVLPFIREKVNAANNA